MTLYQKSLSKSSSIVCSLCQMLKKKKVIALFLVRQSKMADVALLPHSLEEIEEGHHYNLKLACLTHREASTFPSLTARPVPSPKNMTPFSIRQLLKPIISSLYFLYFHLFSLEQIARSSLYTHSDLPPIGEAHQGLLSFYLCGLDISP